MGRILIVDDETPLAEALGALFEMEHIAVATASDRATAERLLAEEHFAVVLADVRLRSEEEGLRLLQSIRTLSPGSKIATMTGYATPALERQLRSLGARQIIYKPIEFDELLRIIRELLGDDDGTPVEELDLDALYSDVRKVLYSLPMRRFGLSGEDAEDIVQEAWCLFLEKCASIRQPRAWLSGTVANLCRQRLTDRTRVIPSEPEFFEDIADTRARASEAILMMHAALERADERTRQLCTLIGLENLSYEEVSARMGLPTGSIGPLYIRAKTKMRRLMTCG
jgi:RNA polymerase sigma factor (sigma-70 family)